MREPEVFIDSEKVSAEVFNVSENNPGEPAQLITREREARALTDAMCSLGAGSRADSDRITYDYRAVLAIEVTDDEIILLDSGSHDEVYR